MTMQAQNPYFTPQHQQQFQPQGFGGLGGFGPQQFGQQFGSQFPQQVWQQPQASQQQAWQQQPYGAQGYGQTLPGYQPVVFQVPQQLVPELVGAGYGQPVIPILPIAYAPIAGQQQFGQQFPQQQFGQQASQQPQAWQQYGQPMHPQQYGQQQFAQRPTLW
jgi:hypothetical protein